MRRGVVFIVVLIGLLAVLLLWMARSGREPALDSTPRLSQGTASPQTRAAGPPKQVAQGDAARGEPPADDMAAYKKWFYEATARDPWTEWKRPIDFWGKVVDQHNVPVSGASVEFSWTDASTEGSSKAQTQSDENGLFSLVGRTGKRLGVDVSKPGYWGIAYVSERSFEYANPFEQNWHRPDPNNPVVFTLWKPANPEPLLMGYHRLRLPNTGLANGFDFLTGRDTLPGDVTARVVVSTNDLPQRLFDWQLELSLPRGGLAETSEAMPFTAPQGGYSNQIVVTRTVGDPSWTEGWKGTFYVAFGEPPRYGLVNLDFVVGWPRFFTNSTLGIEYWINTNGSPNLEKAPALKPRRPLPNQ